MIAALIVAYPSQPAGAQAAVPCTAIADDEERLACYDRALRAASPPAAPTPAAPAAQAPAAAGAASAAPPPAVTPSASSAPAARRADDEEVIPIVIVGVRALPGRETTFTAEDGATWVQTDSQRVVGLPEPPFDAELKPGAMGSRFLVPAGRGRAIRVRRVEP
ncbi:MAG: hypothetical protein EHM50_02815 [Lysobacterales bacterium]|nr:MAG: hypothetical protein EHM50_02815 [Xanthomonadales bacterium]